MTFDRLGRFAGETARPYAILASATAAAIATVLIVAMRFDLIQGAAYITAAWAGVAAIYTAKAFEERGKAKSEAEVQIARTGQDLRQPQPVEVVNSPDQPVPVSAD